MTGSKLMLFVGWTRWRGGSCARCGSSVMARWRVTVLLRHVLMVGLSYPSVDELLYIHLPRTQAKHIKYIP